MARRNKEDGEAVSLFPFLSILACVIGALTLMVMAVAVSSIDESESPEALARKDEVQAIEDQMVLDLEELERLQSLIATAKARLEELELAKLEVEKLEDAKKEAAGSLATEHAKELAEIARLKERIVSLSADVPMLDEQIKALQKQIADKENPKEADVVVRPGGTGFDLEPTFVEVTATGVVIHDGEEPKTVRRADLNRKGGRFHKLIDRVSEIDKGIIILLLRDDGVGTYGTVTYVLRSHYGPNRFARYGKLPILGQGRIDLRTFEAK